MSLSEHRHSGRILAHHHTSYPALAFLLLLSGLLVAAMTAAGRADSSASTLSLTVLGPPPSQAATIDDPSDGQHFTTNSLTVRGSCPTGLMVEIWRNSTFAGSTLCDVNGLYSVVITLTPGANALVARDVDALGQYGPDSGTVTVYYDVPPPPPSPSPGPQPSQPPAPSRRSAAGPAPASPLLITSTQHLYQGADPNAPVQWTVTVSGGRTPYSVSWEWGDGQSDTHLVSNAGPVSMSHTYAKSGTYQVTIRATDAAGAQAVLQVVTVVNGPLTAASLGQSNPGDDGGRLIFIWPLLIVMSLLVSSFWLGERHRLADWRQRGSAAGA